MYPMNFKEFLMASNDDKLLAYLDNINELTSIPSAFFSLLCEKLKLYYIVGGMPEAVWMWVEEKDMSLVERSQSNILLAYEKIFMKHPNIKDFSKLSLLWNHIPSQLAKENKKFIYQTMKKGVRARENEDALQWLIGAELVSKIYRCKAPKLLLSAYDDLLAFKLYLVVVGLLCRHAKLDSSIFAQKSRLFSEFKGAFSKSYILQSLQQQFDVIPRYWAQNNPSYEVDFTLQRKNMIIPIEIKSDSNIKGCSLIKIKELFRDDIIHRVRYSLENLKLDNDILNIPLFLADDSDKLIELALMNE